ncbi:MAG: carbonic anhydrase [Patescibacteria group bacterium]
MTEKHTFATALNCIDGRVQKPVTEWIKNRFNADFVDTITEPGIDKIISHGDRDFVNELKRFVGISVKAHGSKVIVVVGHYGCAADPVLKEEHFEQIRGSVEKVKSWGYEATVVGLWINRQWQVEVVC